MYILLNLTQMQEYVSNRGYWSVVWKHTAECSRKNNLYACIHVVCVTFLKASLTFVSQTLDEGIEQWVNDGIEQAGHLVSLQRVVGTQLESVSNVGDDIQKFPI
jgi:hypothetical protein